MKTYRYVLLDPTGNLTCLVLDPADSGDEAALVRELLKQCREYLRSVKDKIDSLDKE